MELLKQRIIVRGAGMWVGWCWADRETVLLLERSMNVCVTPEEECTVTSDLQSSLAQVEEGAWLPVLAF